MSDEKCCLDSSIDQKILSVDTNTIGTRMSLILNKFHRLKTIKNLIYSISLLDFLIHYVLAVELGMIEQLYRSFTRWPEHRLPSIEVCELPIKKYLPFNLSQISLYIFGMAILTLLLSMEAVRKSSTLLYRLHVISKFISAVASLVLYTIYTLGNLKNNFMHSSLILQQSNNEKTMNFLNIDVCLIYTREKLAVCILAVFNVFVFFLTLECYEVFALLKQENIDHPHHQQLEDEPLIIEV